MGTQESILQKLTEYFKPLEIEVINESSQHNVPKNSETHFRVLLVSSLFDDLGKIQRHQEVYRVLKEELANGVHALTMELHSPGEWQHSPQKRALSPRCLGGEK